MINDRHSLLHCPINSGIDIVNNIPVMLCNIILYVDHDKRFVIHCGRTPLFLITIPTLHPIVR
jgi:hypothetical protein